MTIKRHIICPKGDLIKDMYLVVIVHLRSFEGHLEAITWLPFQIWYIRLASQKKTIREHIT